LNKQITVVKDIKEMSKLSDEIRKKGEVISFVPTMGYLHQGHISLINEGRKRGNKLVVSIYVNPTQFGPNEDLSRYPQDFEGDFKKCEDASVDIIFYPDNSQMYPDGYKTYVNVEDLTENLCGASRPGHFKGVTTIVAKLFNIVKPHIAIFGEKDFQQLAVIRQMINDLNMNIEIVGMPIFREDDGLAMSSRNAYLSPEERKGALILYKTIGLVKELCNNGENDASRILKQAEIFIKLEPLAVIDYLKICDSESLKDVDKVGEETLFALAVKIGRTRLIDNYLF